MKPSIFKVSDLYNFILGILFSIVLTIITFNYADKLSQKMISLLVCAVFIIIYLIQLIQRQLINNEFVCLNNYKILLKFNSYNKNDINEYEILINECVKKYALYFKTSEELIKQKLNSDYIWVEFVDKVLDTELGKAVGYGIGNNIKVCYMMYDSINQTYYVDNNMSIKQTAFIHEIEHYIIDRWLNRVSNNLDHEIMRNT